MVLNKFPVGGGVIANATTWVNNNNNTVLRNGGRNLIRQLQDRAVDFSADGGEWAEAYTDATGRLDSVDIDSAGAWFNTDAYETNTEHVNDTTENSGSYNNPEYPFYNVGSATTGNIGGGSAIDKQMGKTFSSRLIGDIKIKVELSKLNIIFYLNERLYRL
jgi:hypothetical protein